MKNDGTDYYMNIMQYSSSDVKEKGQEYFSQGLSGQRYHAPSRKKLDVFCCVGGIKKAKWQHIYISMKTYVWYSTLVFRNIPWIAIVTDFHTFCTTIALPFVEKTKRELNVYVYLVGTFSSDVAMCTRFIALPLCQYVYNETPRDE